MLRLKQPVIVFIIIMLSGFMSGDLSAEWLKTPPSPQPDVDKDPPGDMTCWLATAANMLAGAGYGDGSDAGERAEDIYDELVARFGRFD